jgi:hypothetical protein
MIYPPATAGLVVERARLASGGGGRGGLGADGGGPGEFPTLGRHLKSEYWPDVTWCQRSWCALCARCRCGSSAHGPGCARGATAQQTTCTNSYVLFVGSFKAERRSQWGGLLASLSR